MRRGSAWFWGTLVMMASLLCNPHWCNAAGFALYEGSARGNALGGTMVGRANDPSALFYNPAGITQLPGLQFMGGLTAIIPSVDVVTHYGGATTTTSGETNVWTPPHAYISYQASDNVWLGLGTFSQFGLGTEFDQNWPGRYNIYKAIVESLTINPNVALKLNDKLSVAAGIDIMWFDVELCRKINASSLAGITLPDIDRKLEGDSFGYGFNLGLRYQPLDWLAFGLSYRSQVKQSLDGTADFTKYGLANASAFSKYFRDSDVSASITLPDMFFAGVVFMPSDRWSVEVGATYTGWGCYDSLDVTYQIDPQNLTSGAATYKDAKKWSSVWRYQIGAEYKALDWLDLRAGYTFDESPIPDDYVDYMVPANDRHLFSVGSGMHWGGWTLDLSYSYLMIEDRDVSARLSSGVLDSDFENGNAHLIGMSVGYKF